MKPGIFVPSVMRAKFTNLILATLVSSSAIVARAFNHTHSDQRMNRFMKIPVCRWAAALMAACVYVASMDAQPLKRVEQAGFGKTEDGSDVKLITLRNTKGM